MKWKTYKQTKKTYPPTLSFRFDGEIKFFKGKQGAKTDPEAQILWLSDVKSQLIGKHPDAGKD